MPVGSVGYGPELIDKMHALFGSSCESRCSTAKSRKAEEPGRIDVCSRAICAVCEAFTGMVRLACYAAPRDMDSRNNSLFADSFMSALACAATMG